ncbi:Deleted in malignant brain tumors 1 protein [Folsomia candida]|uniref:Deleted in malignant brain tumors 1 protein n=1 Tax=Folsomia candida TaxID=158441 RepID=A0A226DQB9_FOLCA|nr:Deleted in malignant brain tumors 1 protein [Folsomia candida]
MHWIVRGPYLTHRFQLISSGLKETDGPYLAQYKHIPSGPGGQIKLAECHDRLENCYYHLERGTHPELELEPRTGFKLDFFSIGATQAQYLTGNVVLSSVRGNFSYPVGGGNYENFESVVFAIAPTVLSQPTVRFTKVDLETGSNCNYDSIRVYNWYEFEYLLVHK